MCYVPVWYDPEGDQIPGVVVPYGTISAVVLLCPVEDRLRQCHYNGCETDDGCWRPFNHMREIQVGQVHQRLYHI